jgi:hypothetical protein
MDDQIVPAPGLDRRGLAQHDPGRRVIARLFAGPHRLVDAGPGKARSGGRVEQQMIDPQPRVARETVSKEVPEGVDLLGGM